MPADSPPSPPPVRVPGGGSPPPPVGILPAHKPVGLTSATLVARTKAALRRLGVRTKVGHAGTLDKLAEGLLLVLVGPATRWFDALQALDKVYLATVRLDAFSATDDADGPFTPVPVAAPPTTDALSAALARFVGTIDQRPPTYSRVHVDGERSADLARRAERDGQATDRPAARPVTIYRIELLDYAWPALHVRVVCGSGTYIRSLARDLGEQLGTGGYLSGLVRERIGPFTLADALPVALDQPLAPETLAPWLPRLAPLPPDAAQP